MSLHGRRAAIDAHSADAHNASHGGLVLATLNDDLVRGAGALASGPLAAWLRNLGLEGYAPAFAAQGIDMRSLPLLSGNDLADLGVLLGHRKLLAKAIAEIAAGGVPSPATQAAAPPLYEPIRAERRQLTVLFCDLVGSTALSKQLDAEVLRDVLRDYQQACGGVIDRYAGHVGQFLGDGLVVYFGYPYAHEDDAERAARAALDIIVAVAKLSGPRALQVRIGIATGAVVVGQSGDGDASVPSAAVGETPILAARLQGLAGPGQIVIAPTTYRLLGDTFEVEDLGEHQLKGIDDPVRARRICGVARNESRFDATRSGRYTPFVGREHEVALLQARWEQACEGEGQVVLLAGEPGIGKSRITQVLRERLADTPHLRLQYQCSPYHSGSAFYPIVERLERAAGFEREDSAERRLDKLEAELALPPEEQPTITPLFAALLSLPVDRYPSRMLSAQKHHELTIAALVDQPLRLARQEPLLIICEDAHWIDPSTLETLTLLVERIRHSAILMVVTCRPEFVPPWTGHGNVTLLNLNRLSRRHGAAMMERLTGGKAVPPEVLAQILDRTDGVPLFVEELTKNLLEAGILRDGGGRYELSGTLATLGIPSTLQDSLMARLDRLAPVKEVAQVGACIGREFDHELLSIVAQLSEADLEAALDRLVASELVFRRGSKAEATYTFKHALVQDAAYEGLLKSRRQQIHGRIAQALEKSVPDAVKARPEVLALHLTRAGSIDAALGQWIAAAKLALGSNRHREGLGHAEAGLAIVEQGSPGQRANHEMVLLYMAADCHSGLSGYASAQAAQLLTRAEALIDRVTDRRAVLQLMVSVVVLAYATADASRAAAAAEQCLSLAEELQDTERRIGACAVAAQTFMYRCDFTRAQQLSEFVLDNYDEARRLAYLKDHNAKVNACTDLAMLHGAIGHLDQARRCARMAVDHATTIAQPLSLLMALAKGSNTLATAGDCEEAMEMSRTCIELSDAQSLPYWKGWALAGEGIALLHRGQPERAEARLGQAFAHLAALGSRMGIPRLQGWRSIALARLGRFAEAREEADDARKQALDTGQQILLPGLTYARGMVDNLDVKCASSAEEWFGRALAEARSRGMRLDELRSATALARLRHQHGRTAEARELLAPIHAWFTEGFDTPPLKEARLLLEEIGDTVD